MWIEAVQEMMILAILYIGLLCSVLWFGRQLRKYRESQESFTDVDDWDSLTRDAEDHYDHV
jgi:hypothetical protein